MSSWKDQLKEALPASLEVTLEEGKDMPCLQPEPQRLVELCKFLCRDERFEFAHCSGVTAYDDFPDEPRFKVVYHLYSYRLKQPLRIKVSVPGENPEVPSLTGIWSGIAPHERETYDMFGVRFAGHEGLKRILMPEEFPHHPLRKDFPLEGIEPDRLYREWEQNRNT